MTDSKLPSLLLFLGTDISAVQKASAAWTKKSQPEDPMNFEMIDARAESVDDACKKIADLREAIQTIPFFGGGKLVWFKNVNFMGDSVMGRSASVKGLLDDLLPMIKAMPEDVRLVMSLLGVDRRRGFFKGISKLAEMKTFDEIDLRKISMEDIYLKIQQRLKVQGLTADKEALELLFQSIGMNYHLLDNNIEKLCCYLGEENKSVSVDDVRMVVRGQRDVEVWDWCNAVLEGKTSQALKILRNLLAQSKGSEEVGLFIILSQQIRLATLTALLLEKGLLKVKSGRFVSAQVSDSGHAYLPRKKSGDPIHPFQLGQVAMRTRDRPFTHWVRVLEVVYKAYHKILFSSHDKASLLEKLVLQATAKTV